MNNCTPIVNAYICVHCMGFVMLALGGTGGDWRGLEGTGVGVPRLLCLFEECFCRSEFAAR